MGANEKWWETFFTGLIVDFWRAAMTPEVTRAEADFFERRLAISPGARLLDVPCGDGRLSLELGRHGYAVTGVDISEDFLDAARRSATEAGIEAVVWRHSDMREMPWEELFDGAFCGGSSFGYLGDAGDLDFLRAVARTLKPGSRFGRAVISFPAVIEARRAWPDTAFIPTGRSLPCSKPPGSSTWRDSARCKANPSGSSPAASSS